MTSVTIRLHEEGGGSDIASGWTGWSRLAIHHVRATRAQQPYTITSHRPALGRRHIARPTLPHCVPMAFIGAVWSGPSAELEHGCMSMVTVEPPAKSSGS